jgi:transposase
MPKVTFKEQPLYAPELFPVNIFDKIPAQHPVRLVEKVVDGLDISSIIKEYKGGGTSAYHPRMMIKVLFYAYLENLYSCRKIEKALQENIHFMYLSGQSTPDFRTINHFRSKVLKDKLQELFKEVVKLLQDLGCVSLEVQYIDGTKIEANANRHRFVWRKSVEKNKKRLEEKIESILLDIEQSIVSDNEEMNKEEIQCPIDANVLKSKIEAINQKLSEYQNREQKEKEVCTKEIEKNIKVLEKDCLPRLERYEEQLADLGERNSMSKTDKDATYMRMKDTVMNSGLSKAAYNVQISTENQYITHVSIHQTPGDSTTLKKHLEGFERLYQKQSKEIVTDAGYGSQENYEYLLQKNIEGYVKYNTFDREQRQKTTDNPFAVEQLVYDREGDFYVCPHGEQLTRVKDVTRSTSTGYPIEVAYYQAKNCEGCPMRHLCHEQKGNRIIEVNHKVKELRAKAKQLLQSEKGKAHLRKRNVDVESVFGQIKHNHNFNRFRLRGLVKVELEFLWVSIAHNLRKLAIAIGKSPDKWRKIKGKQGVFVYMFIFLRITYKIYRNKIKNVEHVKIAL